MPGPCFAASDQNVDAMRLQAWLNDAHDDCLWRAAMVEKIREDVQPYTAEEIAMIARGMALLGTRTAGGGKVRSTRHYETVEVADTVP